MPSRFSKIPYEVPYLEKVVCLTALILLFLI
jgi:hypothetical protein